MCREPPSWGTLSPQGHPGPAPAVRADAFVLVRPDFSELWQQSQPVLNLGLRAAPLWCPDAVAAQTKCSSLTSFPPPVGSAAMKVKIKCWNGVATWLWVANDENCGICRMAFNGCCPDCECPRCSLPVERCLLAWLCHLPRNTCTKSLGFGVPFLKKS